MIPNPPQRKEMRRKRSAVIKWAGEELTLLPGRAVWWKRQSTLFITDPHIGKASSFRAAGIAVPELSHEADLVRLDGMLRKTRARRLVILGDFFHAKTGRTAATMEAVTAWRTRHERLHVILIAGNHDRHAGKPLPLWRIECVEGPWLLPPFQCWHEPPAKPGGFALAGHFHPSVRLSDRAGTSFGGACFHFGANVAVLPAFGGFTGSHAITAKCGERVFLAGDDEVIDVTPLVTPRLPTPRRRSHRFARPVMMLVALFLMLTGVRESTRAADDQPIHSAELIFPLEHWHNHGSCVVEAPNGDLIVCWFHGSGERTADDVKIEGARLRKGSRTWGERFTMADTPGYPDTKCCMFIDPEDRLWLLWPTILTNKNGSLYTLMRDNGPAPKRLMQSESRDRGESWAPVTDSALPNPGSGAEITALRSGRWLLISNDTERGRHSLAVQLSDDEGKSWKWKRHLELSPEGEGRYHYPSIIQARDRTLHPSYSYHLEKGAATGADGQPMAKAIKHAHFNETWIMQEPQK